MIKHVCVFLSLSAIGFVSVAVAQDEEPVNRSVRLNEGWEFVKGDLGGVWETLRSDRRALNLPVWEKVTLPHCYNASDSVDPDVAYYEGPAWYRTKLKIENPFTDGRTLLHFEGAGQKTQVYIGEQLVGSHVGGYDEFTIDITDAVNAYMETSYFTKDDPDHISTIGTIPLAVRCDNLRDLEMIPSDLSDFNLYGGLYRYVNLVYMPAISLERAHVVVSRGENEQWQVAVRARLHNPGNLKDQITLDVRLFDPDKKEIFHSERTLEPPGSEIEICQARVQNPALWSTDRPTLYHCVVALQSRHGKMFLHERFGFRWFEFLEHGPFHLNGKRLLLQGTSRHEDFSGRAAALTEEMMTKEMFLMKDMGVNFVRLGHYQQSDIVLNLCDQLGILVWEEIPWCRGGLGGESYKQQARNMLLAMIDQHRNHPSVILWGLGNENDWPGDFNEFDQQKIHAFMSELNDTAHKLDADRKTAIRRCEFCADIVDVYSPSIWAGWYRGQMTEYKSVSEAEMKKVDHFLHAEWGGDSQARRHAENSYEGLTDVEITGDAAERGLDFLMSGGQARASRDGNWSESYICDLVDWHLKEQQTMDWLTGAAFWIFKDFSTPLRPNNPVPYMNQKGSVERDLTPKEVYYVFQSYWADKPMIRVYAHTWPVRWGKSDEKKLIKIYSNCPEVELFVNGESVGKKQRDSQNFPAAGLRWLVRLRGGLMNHVKAVGWKDSVEVADEITFRYETRSWNKPSQLVLRETQRDGDRVTIEAHLMDDKGVICLDSRQFVRFGLAGDGKLLDNLGTSRGARMVQLYNGRAQIDVQMNREISLASVSSDGVPTAFLKIAPQPDGSSLKSMSRKDQALYVARLDRERILQLADASLDTAPISLRDYPAPAEGVGPGDFYSMGDYWWPNPDTADGLPYVQRDGQSNPDNFSKHRMQVRELRNAVSALAAGYALNGNEAYAKKAIELLNVFFVDPDKRMNPHLLYAQAIPGRTKGRGIGIIDTLHLAEVPLAIQALQSSSAMTPEILAGLKKWFADYSDWMTTHPHGLDELNTTNNHAVAFLVQLASFARLTGDEEKLNLARQRFKEVVLPMQMDLDGSFPRELARTKPYGYSIFQLDNVVLLASLLSTEDENFLNFTLSDGRGVEKAMSFLFEYLQDKSRWFLPPDVQHWKDWPVRQPCLLFSGFAFGRSDYLELWKSLDADPGDLEVRRNMAVTQPLLWLVKAEDVPLLK